MVEINTDKVDAEVPAPVTGVLTEILAPEGAVVPIGGNIAVIEADEAAHAVAPAAGGPTAALAAPPPRPETKATETPAVPAGGTSSSSVSGLLDDAPPTRPVAPHAQVPALEGDQDVPLSPVRRRIAENTALSKATIPHAWQVQEVDMSGVATSIAANRGAVRRQHRRVADLPGICRRGRCRLAAKPPEGQLHVRRRPHRRPSRDQHRHRRRPP